MIESSPKRIVQKRLIAAPRQAVFELAAREAARRALGLARHGLASVKQCAISMT